MMVTVDAAARPSVSYKSHLFRLAALFCAWKALLLVVALASPGPGYDTSTVILFSADPESTTIWRHLAVCLTRWDAIYFTVAAHRGKVFEQEYAFSPYWAKTIALVEQGMSSSTRLDSG
jgi:phosphatidylinositol glycan class V